MIDIIISSGFLVYEFLLLHKFVVNVEIVSFKDFC